MGTISLTRVWNGNDILVNMYRKFDGYPEGHGLELAELMKDRVIGNGGDIPDGKFLRGKLLPEKFSNGPSCFAAQMVAHFKQGYNDIGGIHLYPTDCVDCWEEYTYDLFLGCNEIPRIRVNDGQKIFYGNPDDFYEWCKNPLGRKTNDF